MLYIIYRYIFNTKYLKFVLILGSYTCFGVKLFHVLRVIFLKTFTLEREGARDMIVCVVPDPQKFNN